jgi:hypothetical protein
LSSITEIFSSIWSEFSTRYKSSFWGPLVVSFVSVHWETVFFLIFESPKSREAIDFVRAHVSLSTVAMSFAFAAVYLIFFPWLEVAVEWAASKGRRARNTFQAKEKTFELKMRRDVAKDLEKEIELRIKNVQNQSKLSDIELVKAYQQTLSGENFNRWLSDLEKGPLNSNLNNNIVDFLNKVDAVEGQFQDENIRELHTAFVSKLSTLHSALNENSRSSAELHKQNIIEFAKAAKEAHVLYRAKAREILKV